MTKFDDVLETTSPEFEDSLRVQALKRREYNRRYQAKLRQQAKLLTLEKKIDDNVDYVIGYIKRKYQKEFDAYVEGDTSKKKLTLPVEFENWLIVSGQTYSSPRDAYEVSGLNQVMKSKKFTDLFLQCFIVDDQGTYHKR